MENVEYSEILQENLLHYKRYLWLGQRFTFELYNHKHIVDREKHISADSLLITDPGDEYMCKWNGKILIKPGCNSIKCGKVKWGEYLCKALYISI